MLIQETQKKASPAASRDVIERPILASEVIDRDGAHSVHFRVFCSTKRASVSLDTCRECPALREVAGESAGIGAWVRCGRQVPRSTESRETTSETPDGGPTGARLGAATSAVRHDLTLQKLRSHFVERLISSVYVVDASNRLVGVVRDVDLLLSRLMPCIETAAQVMMPILCVREDMAVRPALLEMAKAKDSR